MHCKTCKFGNFSTSPFGSPFGSCNRLEVVTEDNDEMGGEPMLSAADKQPLAFTFVNTEVGFYSSSINIHPDFGCVLFEQKQYTELENDDFYDVRRHRK